jgi:hypothetical protein
MLCAAFLAGCGSGRADYLSQTSVIWLWRTGEGDRAVRVPDDSAKEMLRLMTEMSAHKADWSPQEVKSSAFYAFRGEDAAGTVLWRGCVNDMPKGLSLSIGNAGSARAYYSAAEYTKLAALVASIAPAERR